MWRWELWCRKTWEGKTRASLFAKEATHLTAYLCSSPVLAVLSSLPYVNSSAASLPKYQLPVLSSCCWRRTHQRGLPFWEARSGSLDLLLLTPNSYPPRGNCLPQVNNHHPLNLLLLCVREVVLSHDCCALFSFRAPLCMWGARQDKPPSPLYVKTNLHDSGTWISYIGWCHVNRVVI